MKVAINKEIGGFWLPDSALLRLVELGMPHFIQETEDLSGMPKDSIFVWESYDNPGRKRRLTLFYKSREESGVDGRVIRAIEEFINSDNPTCYSSSLDYHCGECSSNRGVCVRLAIVDIPDNIEWYINENEMGIESIHEKHRIWSAE